MATSEYQTWSPAEMRRGKGGVGRRIIQRREGEEREREREGEGEEGILRGGRERERGGEEGGRGRGRGNIRRT